MKYVIDVPEGMITSSGELMFHYKNTKDLTYQIYTGINVIPYTEPDCKAIEDEVWELVKKIECLTVGETEDCFDVEYDGIPFVANMFSYQEAKVKYEVWKKQKDEIRVGDEVKHKKYEWRGFVINISKGGQLTLICGLGEVSFWFNLEDFEKTGKHCAEVEELVKKIQKESEK